MSKINPEIHKTNPYSVFLIVLSDRQLFLSGIKLLWTIFRSFFYPQFHGKYFLGRYDVASLSHPLDNDIPFQPQYIDNYLSFVHLWIRSIVYTYKTVGRSFLPHFRQYIQELTLLYKQTGQVYKQCQSTTIRPKYPFRWRFWVVALADPHRHCLPSLHIEIVYFNFYKMCEYSELFGDTHPQLRGVTEYALAEARLITESVLLVKQHSLYCLSAALYFLEGKVKCSDAARLKDEINQWFRILLKDDVNAQAYRESVIEQYHRFFAAEQKGLSKVEVLVDFLRNNIRKPKASKSSASVHMMPSLASKGLVTSQKDG